MKSKPEGKSLVESLEKSKNVFTIEEGRSGNEARADSYKDASSGKGCGGTIRFDPKSKQGGINERGDRNRPPEIGLGHELYHAKDYDRGTYDRTPDPVSGITIKELKATEGENKLRNERTEPLRTEYGGKKLPHYDPKKSNWQKQQQKAQKQQQQIKQQQYKKSKQYKTPTQRNREYKSPSQRNREYKSPEERNKEWEKERGYT